MYNNNKKEENPVIKQLLTWGWKRIGIVAVSCIIGLTLLIELGSAYDTNKSGHIVVKQAAIFGDMTVIRDPGMYWLLWGYKNEYTQAGTLYFATPEECTGYLKQDRDAVCVAPIVVQFNDGARALVKGSTRYELPVDPDKMIELHSKFRSFNSFITSSIERLSNQAVTLTASLMSAEESYTTHRARFTEMSGDQLAHGIYLTQTHEESLKPMKAVESAAIEPNAKKEKSAEAPNVSVADSSQERRFVVRIMKDATGKSIRMPNPLEEMTVKISQFVVSDIDYDPEVDERIKKKQEALQAAIQAGAKAEQAKQQALQAEQEGLKNVMEARYLAEVAKTQATINALREKEVAETQATQRLNVAIQDAATAEQYATKIERESKADAAKKQRLLAADNGFELKMQTYLKVAEMSAKAYKERAGAVVPQVVVGGGTGGNTGPMDLLSIIAARAATDLGVSLK